LVDTGPFVAYFDPKDPSHEAVAERLEEFSGQLVTTGAVVTEVMHFLSTTPGGPEAFAELLDSSGTWIADLFDTPRIVQAAEFMARYDDTPMDFADATLVLLAEALGVGDILTLDRRGFSAYRMKGRKTFRLVLDD
jgi:predicted nucleic acid-binding protein